MKVLKNLQLCSLWAKKMEYLIKNIDSEEIERITGENEKTIKQWKKGTKKIPESAIRLLRFNFNGDASKTRIRKA